MGRGAWRDPSKAAGKKKQARHQRQYQYQARNGNGNGTEEQRNAEGNAGKGSGERNRTHLVVENPVHLERLDKVAELRARGHDDALERALVDLGRHGLDDERAQGVARRRERGHERGRAEPVVECVLDGQLHALHGPPWDERGCYGYRTIEPAKTRDDGRWEGRLRDVRGGVRVVTGGIGRAGGMRARGDAAIDRREREYGRGQRGQDERGKRERDERRVAAQPGEESVEVFWGRVFTEQREVPQRERCVAEDAEVEVRERERLQLVHVRECDREGDRAQRCRPALRRRERTTRKTAHVRRNRSSRRE